MLVASRQHRDALASLWLIHLLPGSMEKKKENKINAGSVVGEQVMLLVLTV